MERFQTKPGKHFITTDAKGRRMKFQTKRVTPSLVFAVSESGLIEAIFNRWTWRGMLETPWEQLIEGPVGKNK